MNFLLLPLILIFAQSGFSVALNHSSSSSQHVYKVEVPTPLAWTKNLLSPPSESFLFDDLVEEKIDEAPPVRPEVLFELIAKPSRMALPTRFESVPQFSSFLLKYVSRLITSPPLAK